MAPVTRLERDAPAPRTDTLHRLERLAGTLAERGMNVSLVAPPGRVPWLEVVHPAVGAGGDVYAARCRDGDWWFWWPWAERIATEGDLDTAAATIEEALAAR